MGLPNALRPSTYSRVDLERRAREADAARGDEERVLGEEADEGGA